MKELTTEQKAQRYDEAIPQLKGLLDGIHEEKTEMMEEDITNIFPELLESEDERIRKAIVLFFELQDDNTTYSFIPKKDILAWLEQQAKSQDKGEQQPAWSKEDEHWRQKTIDFIKHPDLIKATPTLANHIVVWLKSLKDRVGCEVNCTTTKEWKPSDEQIEVLTWCLPLFVEPRSKAVLQSLINDLKKLKEE